MMKIKRISIKAYFITALVCAFLGISAELYLSTSFKEKINTRKFSETLHLARTELRGVLEKYSENISKKGIDKFISETNRKLSQNPDFKKYHLFILHNKKLLFWSDNSFGLGNWQYPPDSLQPVSFINNTWVIADRLFINDIELIGFFSIKKEYPVENKFLSNSFNEVFNITDILELSVIPREGAFHITDNSGNFLFSLCSDNKFTANKALNILPVMFYIISLLLLLAWIIRLCTETRMKRLNLTLFLTFFALFSIRFLMIFLKLPAVLYSSEFFSPVAYASSAVFPSLGDLFLNSMLIFYFTALFYNNYPVRKLHLTGNHAIYLLMKWMAVCVTFSLLIVYLSKSLILDSSISFDIFNVQEINLNSLISFLIFISLISPVLLLFDKTVLILGQYYKTGLLVLLIVVITVLISVPLLIFSESNEFYSPAFIAVSFSLISYIRSKQKKYSFNHFILFLFITSVFLTFFTIHYYKVKTINKRKVIAVSLSNERDLVAEMLIKDLHKKISEDRIISDLARKSIDKRQDIVQYLKDNYFYGFWSKYDIQATVCSHYDNLRLETTGELFGCYDFFDNIADNTGLRLPETDFYYINNDNGRISYLGFITFNYKGNDSLSSRLFIELDSRLLTQELGYPDLLLDSKMSEANITNKYSYAKYRNGKLVTRNGKFDYKMAFSGAGLSQNEFSLVQSDGHEHILYNSDKNTTIILTMPAITFYDRIISFFYIFTLLFVCFMSYFLYTGIRSGRFKITFNIRTRIMISFIAILVLSFIIIGTGTVIYIINRYEKKNYENISEKMQSILIELNAKIGQEERLIPEQKGYLTSILIKLSNVFYEDINLYDSKGNLLATSRSDIFSKGLTGYLMNPEAYYNIAGLHKPEYIANEKIGKLEYLSSYVPYYNTKGKILAYLNLPYFTRQNILTSELSTFVIALVNIYLILILLSVSFTIFIANGLTRPLVLLQKKFGEIELGKKNEPIAYRQTDEIGSLVTEYNRMLEELSKSAEMLAKSERETAWREMARQIAHEIKNPLTPMKLSVQHLKRSFEEQSQDWEKLIPRMCNTLIDQIDALSAIASEFSNFARLPQPVIEKVNVIEKARSIADLYSESGNTTISLITHNNDELNVMADKEQILRILTNLVKNAIQAIPAGKEGLVEVEILNYSSTVIIKVSDNGTGIPEDLQKNLFVPNFTTKTSGMGLGLAIVKNMITEMGGQIRFVTRPGQGTTFFVELPKAD